MYVCVSGHLNLGKKINVPRDIMIEELQTPSNRGSRMFQERMKRAQMFAQENEANTPTNVRGFAAAASDWLVD